MSVLLPKGSETRKGRGVWWQSDEAARRDTETLRLRRLFLFNEVSANLCIRLCQYLDWALGVQRRWAKPWSAGLQISGGSVPLYGPKQTAWAGEAVQAPMASGTLRISSFWSQSQGLSQTATKHKQPPILVKEVMCIRMVGFVLCNKSAHPNLYMNPNSMCVKGSEGLSMLRNTIKNSCTRSQITL